MFEIHSLEMAVNGNHQRETHGHLSGGDGDDVITGQAFVQLD